jgi:hypothetical protein
MNSATPTTMLNGLKARGADLEEKDIDGKTAMHWAVHRKDAKCLQKVLSTTSTYFRDGMGRTVMHICTVLVVRRPGFALEDAIEFYTFAPLEILPCGLYTIACIVGCT